MNGHRRPLPPLPPGDGPASYRWPRLTPLPPHEPLPPLCPPPARFDPVSYLVVGIFLACLLAAIGIGSFR